MSTNSSTSESTSGHTDPTPDSPAEISPAGITQLNVGGEKFITITSTLTQGSTYFAKLLSPQWIRSATKVDNKIFVDADPLLFRHILNYLRRSLPPIFWTRTEGFDYPLYAALREEARYFGIESLEQWIAEERYMARVTIKESIETVDLADCLSGRSHHSDDKRKHFHPSDYETKGGLKRKRIEVQHWVFTAPAMRVKVLSISAGVWVMLQKAYGPNGDAAVIAYNPDEIEADKRLAIEQVGGTPVVNHGAIVILGEVNILKDWMHKMRQFIRPSDRPNVLLAFGKHSDKERMVSTRGKKNTGPWRGCYKMEAKFMIKDGDWTHRYVSSINWTDKTVVKTWESEGMPMKRVLPLKKTIRGVSLPDGDDRAIASPSSTGWWILSTPRSMVDWVAPIAAKMAARNTKKPADGVDTVAAALFWDEFHEAVGPNTNPYPSLQVVHGQPPIIGISATPMSKVQQLGNLFMAAFAKYFDTKHGEYEASYSAIGLANRQYGSPEGTLKFKSSVPDYKKNAIVHASFIGKYQFAQTLDRHTAGITFKAVHAEGDKPDEEEVEVAEAGLVNKTLSHTNVVAALTVLKAWLAPQWIQADHTLMWRPNGVPGEHAIDVPPHAHFDLQSSLPVSLNEEVGNYKEDVASYYAGIDATWEEDMVKPVAMAIYNKWRVLLLWPCLDRFMATDNDLLNELSSFNRGDCEKITKDPKGSELWKYMDEVMKTPVAEEVVNIIQQVRGKFNALRFHEKLVISSDKPFNAVVVHLILLKMLESPIDTTITSERDFKSLYTWGGDVSNRKTHIDAFTTTNPSDVDYQDSLFILNAVGSTIKVGISLPPAKRVLLMDGCWSSNATKQTTGRVSRSSDTQLAETTESYRIVVATEFGCKLMIHWLCGRNASQQNFNRALTAHTVGSVR